MDDEMFVTHLLNSLPQAEYEGAILVIKERLRSRSCDLAEVERLLEDKYLSMKYVKGWEEEEDDYALFAGPVTKIICYNCREMGHFAQDCLKPRKNTNIARENEQNRKLAKLMDLGNHSVCKECAMICTDAYSDEEYEEMVVYGDQGITSKKFDEDTYGELMNTDSNEEPIIKYNVALYAQDSVSLEKK